MTGALDAVNLPTMNPATIPLSREFNLGALLNITTGILLTSMDDVYALTQFLMQDDGINTIGLVMVADRCRAELVRQHPFLSDDSMKADLQALTTDMLDAEDDDMDAETENEAIKVAIDRWLSTMEIMYGARHSVTPLTPVTP